jgi:pimeloyl-ACP methyl ester carboxylesterase
MENVMNSESASVQHGYAPVNGLEMYYEIHGAGDGVPLVILHGAFMTIDGWDALLPALARTRRVIAVEQQGHGRTADIDRPLRHEHLADDVAALLEHLGVEHADVLGYSLGAGTALQVALRHPDRVRKLVYLSFGVNADGYEPGVADAIQSITADLFYGSPMHDAYTRVAPDPNGLPGLVEKVKDLAANRPHVAIEQLGNFPAPTMLIFGDSDGYRLEQAVEFFRQRGGGVFGDLTGLPPTRLAVLPGTTHVALLGKVDVLEPMIVDFLEAPVPVAGQADAAN